MKVIIRRVEETIIEVDGISEMRQLRKDVSDGTVDVQDYCYTYGIEGSLEYTVKPYKE